MKTESDLPHFVLELDEEMKRQLEIKDRRREESAAVRSEK